MLFPKDTTISVSLPDIIYRRLQTQDLDAFIDMRIQQLREEGAKEDMDLVPSLRDYYERHMMDGTFVSWLAMDGDSIIGTSGMSFVEKPPYFGCPTGKIGLLSSMFEDRLIGIDIVCNVFGNSYVVVQSQLTVNCITERSCRI